MFFDEHLIIYLLVFRQQNHHSLIIYIVISLY